MNQPLLRAAAATLIALIALCVAWELWLAPLRPGGSWLVLKVLPLLLVLRGVLAGRNYVLQWSVLLIWLYVTEGLVRVASDSGTAMVLAGLEVALAAAYFICVAAILRPLKKLAREHLKGDTP